LKRGLLRDAYQVLTLDEVASAPIAPTASEFVMKTPAAREAQRNPLRVAEALASLTAELVDDRRLSAGQAADIIEALLDDLSMPPTPPLSS
jgi:hypothetical protein